MVGPGEGPLAEAAQSTTGPGKEHGGYRPSAVQRILLVLSLLLWLAWMAFLVTLAVRG